MYVIKNFVFVVFLAKKICKQGDMLIMLTKEAVNAPMVTLEELHILFLFLKQNCLVNATNLALLMASKKHPNLQTKDILNPVCHKLQNIY